MLLLLFIHQKWDKSLLQSVMQLQSVTLVALHGQLPVVEPSAHHHAHLLPPGVEVPIGNTEIGEQQFILRLDPQLRVAHNNVEVVVGHSPPVLLRQQKHLPVGERNQQAILIRDLLGDEPSLRVASQQKPVFESNEDDEVRVVVDVLMHVDLVLGVEVVDQLRLTDTARQMTLQNAHQELFVVFLLGQYAEVEECGETQGEFDLVEVLLAVTLGLLQEGDSGGKLLLILLQCLILPPTRIPLPFQLQLLTLDLLLRQLLLLQLLLHLFLLPLRFLLLLQHCQPALSLLIPLLLQFFLLFQHRLSILSLLVPLLLQFLLLPDGLLQLHPHCLTTDLQFPTLNLRLGRLLLPPPLLALQLLIPLPQCAIAAFDFLLHCFDPGLKNPYLLSFFVGRRNFLPAQGLYLLPHLLLTIPKILHPRLHPRLLPPRNLPTCLPVGSTRVLGQRQGRFLLLRLRTHVPHQYFILSNPQEREYQKAKQFITSGKVLADLNHPQIRPQAPPLVVRPQPLALLLPVLVDLLHDDLADCLPLPLPHAHTFGVIEFDLANGVLLGPLPLLREEDIGAAVQEELSGDEIEQITVVLQQVLTADAHVVEVTLHLAQQVGQRVRRGRGSTPQGFGEHSQSTLLGGLGVISLLAIIPPNPPKSQPDISRTH